MIEGKSVLAIIPARGGSKGLPGKNILPLHGKPLIAWTIEAALQSKYVDRSIVSTDDQDIMNTAIAHGGEVPFLRPAELSSDTASSLSVVRHATQLIRPYDIIVLLQPTSPLRTASHIDEALRLFMATSSDSCISVTPVTEHPQWMFDIDAHGRLHPFVKEPPVHRRQDLKKLHRPNGAIYIIKESLLPYVESLLTDNTVAYCMEAVHSIDIDDAQDLASAKSILEKTCLLELRP